MTIGIESAKLQDLPRVLELLKSGKLPVDGLSGHLNTTLVLREGERVGGCVALEIYGAAALLRSPVVEKQHRDEGWGKRLTHAALEIAQEKGITSLSSDRDCQRFLCRTRIQSSRSFRSAAKRAKVGRVHLCLSSKCYSNDASAEQ